MISKKSDAINPPCADKPAADDVQTPEGADIPITDVDSLRAVDGQIHVHEQNITSLRLSQDFSAAVGAKKVLTKVAVRKPHGQDWIRVNEDPAMRMNAAVIDFKEEGELYLVDASLQDKTAKEWVAMALILTVNRQGAVYLWPIRLPNENGWLHSAPQSAWDAADEATKSWVRVTWNGPQFEYDVTRATAEIPDPVWPEESFEQIIMLAFQGRIIEDKNHHVLRQLRGEI